MSTRSSGWRYDPGIWNDSQVEAWKPVFKAIHDQGSKVFQQNWVLQRAGRLDVLKEEANDLVSSSLTPISIVDELPRAMTVPEISEYVQ